MPLRLEIKKKLSARSERVKCVDFHPSEPWILAALYSGHIFIWNYSTQAVVKSAVVGDLPVRCARFVAHKQWIVCGADDMLLRVYNYNTMERVHAFEAHTDYIRALAVHPTLPLILSSSDDMLIKLWDWEKGWECVQTFEGHTHYVMQVEFNPKDSNTFASASLDKTVKVWGLNASTHHFSLEGHERGVNCISYFRGGDRPYLVSGADDNTVKVWDYQTKSCVATLEGHTNNISCVAFHPQLPIILSGSEDGTVRIWHSQTYRLENTLNYGMERVWTVSCLRDSNKVALGYDDGTIMIQIGHEEPVASMERGGKVVWAHNHEIVTASVKTAADTPDGDRLPLAAKELGHCELYPQGLTHSPNGRLLCACGDGEYIIYTALSLKNKSFGSALEFVWADDAGVYATRESSSRIKVFKDFKESKSFRPSFAAEGIFGGALLGVRSADFIDLYSWADCRIVRRIDVVPRKVFWSESGELLILACETSFFVLRYNKELVDKFDASSVEVSEQGIEGSFELEQEIGEKVRGGSFVGDCFIYTNTAGRLNYYVGGEVQTLAHLSKPLYLLGYLPKEHHVYVMDKNHNVYSYSLPLAVLIYQSAIVRRDMDSAARALGAVPQDQRNKMARFLEAQDLKELALTVTTDPEHKFDLAMALRKLALAKGILLESLGEGGAEPKWKALGDAALAPPPSAPHEFDLKLAEECYTHAGDLGGLLLLYTSLADVNGMERLAKLAEASGRNNVAFLCHFLLHHLDACIRLLCQSDRVPEAAFLTRTYAPSRISSILAVWKENLSKVSLKAAEALADPDEYSELFADLGVAMRVEAYLASAEGELLPAILYGDYSTNVTRNLIADMKEGRLEPVSDEQVQQLQQAAAQASVSPQRGDDEEDEGEVEEKTQAPVASQQAPVQEDEEKVPSPVPSPVAVQAPKPVAAVVSASPVAAASPPPAKPATPVAAASPVARAPVTQQTAPASNLHITASSPASAAQSTPNSAAAALTPSSSPSSASSAGLLATKAPSTPVKPAVSPARATASPAVASAVRAPVTAAPAALTSPIKAASPSPSAAAAASPASAYKPAAAAAAVAAPVASAITPKPAVPAAAAAVVAPKAVGTPKAATPVAAAAKPVVPAAAPMPSAADLNLSGDDEDFDEDDLLGDNATSASAAAAGGASGATSPGGNAPEPSAEELAARLKEIEDEDFGDF